MKKNVYEKTISKTEKILKGSLVSKLEVYDNDKINEILDIYDSSKITDLQEPALCIEEYSDGIKHIIVKGISIDNGNNKEDYEEHIIIKKKNNLFSFSTFNAKVSYLQLLNPDLDGGKLLPGKGKLCRERFFLYIGDKRRFYSESFAEEGSDKIVFERYNDYNNDDIKFAEIYYDVLGSPIYEIYKDSNGHCISVDNIAIKDSLELTIDEVGNDIVLKK